MVMFRQNPQYTQRMRLAQAMTAAGNDGSPVQHPLQAIGRVAQAYSGHKLAERTEAEEQERRKKTYSELADAFSGGVNQPEGDRRQQLVDALMANPDTADYGAQLGTQMIMEKPERKVAKDARGRSRYQDTGDFVFDDMADYDKNVLSPEALAQKQAIAQSGRSQIVNRVDTGTPVPQYNKLPAEYVYKRGPDGQILIDEEGVPTVARVKGGPSDVESKQNRTQRESRLAGHADKVELLEGLIDEAKAESSVWTTGFMGSALSGVSQTPAHDMLKRLDTIKANIGFDRLQEMRDNSPTGGALGQVSEMENRLLQAVWGNLEQSQSREAFEKNLELVKQQVRASWERVARAYEQDYGVPYDGEMPQERQDDPLGIR